jgi:carbonic anhydrase
LFVGCSDSRVVPNLFASTEPGDLFVIRNVGNLVAPKRDGPAVPGGNSVAAAVEFSTAVLHVTDIVVCGHSDCGAMRALIDPAKRSGLPQIGEWLTHAEPAVARLAAGERLNPALSPMNNLAQLNVLAQLEHLKTYPVVQAGLAAGSLRLHGWYFDIGGAEVSAYEPDQNKFVLIDEAEAERILARLE